MNHESAAGLPRHLLALLMALLLALAGCSSLNPPPKASPESLAAYKQAQALPNAIAVAETLRDNYLDRANAMRREERWAGLGLIGMGLIAGDLAIRGVAQSEVLGLTLGATGLYAANNWANPKAEALIYIEGAAAVQCAITAVQPLSLAYGRRADLTRAITELQSRSSALNDALVPFGNLEHKTVVRARNAVAKATALIPLARAAANRLDQAGGQLYSTLGAIQLGVERAQAHAAPDFRALAASLIDQKILGPSPLLAQPKDVKTSGSEKDLERPTQLLEASIAEAEDIIALVNTKPATGELQNCKVDVAAAGITLKVDPVVLTVPAGTTKFALASGGVSSYNAIWFGAAPSADQVALKAEQNGIISVEAKATASPGTYSVLVVDGGKGRETLQVNITAAAAANGTAGTGSNAPAPAPAAGACTPVPKVKAVQQALADHDKTAAADKKVNAGKVDGCMGPVTIAAMKKFYSVQGMPADSISNDPETLIEEITRDLVTKAKN